MSNPTDPPLAGRTLSPAQRGEAFTGSEQYAAGRMTHAIITQQAFSPVQSEVVHDALMAAFQAGYLACGEGISVEALLARMAELNDDGRDPGDRDWWEADYRLLDASGQVWFAGTEEVIADDEDGVRYLALAALNARLLEESGKGSVVIDAIRKI